MFAFFGLLCRELIFPVCMSFDWIKICESKTPSNNVVSGPMVVASFVTSTKSIFKLSMTCKSATFIQIKFNDCHTGTHVEKNTITSFDCVKLDEFSVTSNNMSSEPISLGSSDASEIFVSIRPFIYKKSNINATFIENYKYYHKGTCRKRKTITSSDCPRLDEFLVSSTNIILEFISVGSSEACLTFVSIPSLIYKM